MMASFKARKIAVANAMKSAHPSSSVLVAVLIASVATTYGFGISLFSQIIPDMREDLGFGYAFVGTVTGLVQIGFAVQAGLGLAQRFHAISGNEVMSGEAVELLVPFEPPRRQFHFYYPSCGQPPKLQAFIDRFCR